MKIKTQHGFTLIELVVVIAILGILAGIAIPRFMDAQATARGSRILADMRTLESALTMYTVNNTVKANDKDKVNGVYEIQVLKDAGHIAAVPKPPTGLAKFPAGGTIDVASSMKYIIRYQPQANRLAICLTYGSGFYFDIAQLQTLTDSL